MTQKKIEQNRVEGIKATSPKGLLIDYGSEVMALVQKGKTEKLAQLTDKAYEELCQLFTQPLDKELREKIARILCDLVADTYSKDRDFTWEQIGVNERNWFIATADLILALLPDIEEAKKQEKIEAFARLCNMPEAGGYDWVMSKEALGWLYMMRTNAECQRIIWQALKGSN